VQRCCGVTGERLRRGTETNSGHNWFEAQERTTRGVTKE
jgi:hypothetical protein